MSNITPNEELRQAQEKGWDAAANQIEIAQKSESEITDYLKEVNPYRQDKPINLDYDTAKEVSRVLRALAQELKSIEDDPYSFGPYSDNSGYQADGWGVPSQDIDKWYAEWLEEKATLIRPPSD